MLLLLILSLPPGDGLRLLRRRDLGAGERDLERERERRLGPDLRTGERDLERE